MLERLLLNEEVCRLADVQNEPPHEKIRFLPVRKQRRRSAVQ